MARFGGWKLKYYKDEAEEYRDVRALGITEDDASKYLRKLCRHFKVPHINLEFVNGQRKYAHYSPSQHKIRLVRNWMNYHTLAHEFAHYWDDMKRKSQVSSLHAQMYQLPRFSEEFPILQRRITKIQNANWHGKRHAKLQARTLAYMEKKGWMEAPQAAKAEAKASLLKRIESIDKQAVELTKTIDFSGLKHSTDLVAATFNALPETLQCPKCWTVRPKAEFGVRVMARDAAGTPTKVRRQSYCKHCR